MIYDYSLVPGDSAAFQTYNTAFGLYNRVLDTGSLYLSSGFSGHTIVFDSAVIGLPHNNYWVSGIGSSLGFLGSHCNNTLWGFFATHMLCYANGSFQYKFPNGLISTVADICFDMAILGDKSVPDVSSLISLYPNPVTSNQISYVGPDPCQVVELSISDISGRSVFLASAPFNVQSSITVKLPSAGFYVARLYLADGRIVVKKLVKQ